MKSLRQYISTNIISDIKSKEISNNSAIQIDASKSDVKLPHEFWNKCNISNLIRMYLLNFYDVKITVHKYTGVKNEIMKLWYDLFVDAFFLLLIWHVFKSSYHAERMICMASLFVKRKTNYRSFVMLKKALHTEFGKQINSV